MISEKMFSYYLLKIAHKHYMLIIILKTNWWLWYQSWPALSISTYFTDHSHVFVVVGFLFCFVLLFLVWFCSWVCFCCSFVIFLRLTSTLPQAKRLLKVLATIPYFNFHFFPHLLIFLQFKDPSYVLKGCFTIRVHFRWGPHCDQ